MPRFQSRGLGVAATLERMKLMQDTVQRIVPRREEAENDSAYYVVHNGNFHRRDSEKIARDEAIERARANPGDTIVVLKAVAAFKTAIPPVSNVPLAELDL